MLVLLYTLIAIAFNRETQQELAERTMSRACLDRFYALESATALAQSLQYP